MRFIKLDLLTLLISLFLFASCESTSTIGLEVDPSVAIQGSLVDTITITSRTVADDIASTNLAYRHPLGFIKDPIFGTTESSIAMTVNLPIDAYNFQTQPVLDSAILVLNYGGQFYGDSTANYSFEVRQLGVNLARESSFLSTREYPVYNTIVGSKTGRLFPTTRYKVTDVVKGVADTVRSVTPQLRIAIDKQFIQENIIGINEDNRKYNANFTRYFGGLQVKLNKANSTGNGGMSFIDFEGSNSALVLYYKYQNNSTLTKDTVQISFPIATASNPIAATITHDRTGTPVANQLSKPTEQFPVTYLQAMSGVRNRISFPYLKKFATNVGKIVINKAELVIDVEPGTDVIPYGAAPRLALYINDIAEKRQNLPDNSNGSSTTSGDVRAVGDAAFGGYYNVFTKQYVFTVTSYIQDLLDGKTTDYGTFLAVTPLSEFEITSSIGTAARSIISSFKASPATGEKRMRLNVYYTKIN